MDFYRTIIEQAAERWRMREKTRHHNKFKLETEGVVGAESAERIQLRLDRLAQSANNEKAFVGSRKSPADLASSSPGSLIENIGLERVVGKSDFLNMNFLEMALAVSRFVCRIHIRTVPALTLGYGTGFMISPRLLITNNHVLSTPQEAVNSEIEFDYQYDRYGRLLPVVTYGLEPETFFKTDKNLDFTIVAVRERSFNDIELKRFGWSRLIAEQGKAILGDTLNIIQHPKGEAKQIVLRSNRLVDLLEDFAHYETDTERGSSGAPVYNDQWEPVALHHSGVPKKVGENLIAKNGSIWQDGMDPDDIDWVANEGVRISSIINHLKKQEFSISEEALFDEMLHREPPHPFEAAAMANASKELPAYQQLSDTSSDSRNIHSFTIPFQLTVQLSISQTILSSNAPNQISGTIHTQNTKYGNTSIVDSVKQKSYPQSEALRDSLVELETARNETYYNEAEDRANRTAYYQNIQIGNINETELFNKLHDLVDDTHTNLLSYNNARHKHLYPRVDLHQDKMLHSIYTGEIYEPESFIRNDFAITERLMMQTQEFFLNKSSFNEAAFSDYLEVLEAETPYNAEHVVPQSWFAKRDPMKSDLHHLFSCEVACNSFRGNIPFFEFVDFDEVVRSGCGRREDGKFEPSNGHGAVARATFYFLLRYPGEINNNKKEYTDERISMLLVWHEKNPVTEYELHRNAEIFKIQGNRNPLIDYPEWAKKIKFSLGLG